MAFLTPQEKKRLSYERDRRNSYGENSKSSRKAIPLRKAKTKRAIRKRATQIVAQAARTDDLLADNAPENCVRSIQPKHWRKDPDAPLKEHVAIRLKRRKRRANNRSAGDGS